MNATTEGQPLAEVGRIRDKISAATEDVFLHLTAI